MILYFAAENSRLRLEMERLPEGLKQQLASDREAADSVGGDSLTCFKKRREIQSLSDLPSNLLSFF